MKSLFAQLGYEGYIKAFDKKIPKKKLFLQGDLSKAQRDLITAHVEEIRISYVLNRHTYPMEEIINEDEHYDCIQCLFITLREKTAFSSISRVIHEQLPAPTLLIFHLSQAYLFSTALKRINRNDKSRVLVQEYHHSSWLDSQQLSPAQCDFLTSIALASIPSIDYKQAYTYLHQCIFKEKHAVTISSLSSEESFSSLKHQTEQEERQLREIKKLTKSINQSTLSLRERADIAKQIRHLQSQLKNT